MKTYKGMQDTRSNERRDMLQYDARWETKLYELIEVLRSQRLIYPTQNLRYSVFCITYSAGGEQIFREHSVLQTTVGNGMDQTNYFKILYSNFHCLILGLGLTMTSPDLRWSQTPLLQPSEAAPRLRLVSARGHSREETKLRLVRWLCALYRERLTVCFCATIRLFVRRRSEATITVGLYHSTSLALVAN